LRCNSTQWDKRFQEYLSYVKITGDVNPQASIVFQGKNIGKWCSKQRVKYKNSLLDDRVILLLESVQGWQWDLSDRSASNKSKLGIATRPTRFDTEIATSILNDRNNGLSLKNISEKYNISTPTYYLWMKKLKGTD
jgi:hypothetical protein